MKFKKKKEKKRKTAPCRFSPLRPGPSSRDTDLQVNDMKSGFRAKRFTRAKKNKQKATPLKADLKITTRTKLSHEISVDGKPSDPRHEPSESLR